MHTNVNVVFRVPFIDPRLRRPGCKALQEMDPNTYHGSVANRLGSSALSRNLWRVWDRSVPEKSTTGTCALDSDQFLANVGRWIHLACEEWSRLVAL